MHRYRITATCRAIVTETWIVTSKRPLTEDEIRDSFGGSTVAADVVTLDCINEVTSDEEDRIVTEIEDEGEEGGA